MPKVTIIKPSLTQEEEKKAFENIAHVLEKIIEKEYGVKVKYTLERRIS